MTAEIAIMNREAVALAADSAVTVFQGRTPRVFATSNKLFALSRSHPVGIMVYGNASFMRVPWETVIKLYRARLDDTSFSTIREYADNFISFLETESKLAPLESQEMYVKEVLSSYFEWMVQEFEASVQQKLIEEAISKPEEVPELFREEAERVIDSHYQAWKRATYVPEMGAAFARELRRRYREIIQEAKESAFSPLLTSATSRRLSTLAGWLLSKYDKQTSSSGDSGIVIAGFGEDEIFPSIQSFDVSGIAGGKLKYWRDDRDSKEISANVGARIIPFAQDEMVHSFMEGIEPNFWIEILSAVSGLLEEYPIAIIDNIQGVSDQERKRLKRSASKVSKKAFEAFSEDFDGVKVSTYVNPVVSTIAAMPKSELPAVAEALVNLQSFKRRVSGEQETVGGPIDVMLISKGDGLIWINRKHYFEPSLNPQYFQAAHKLGSHDATEVERTLEGSMDDDRSNEGATNQASPHCGK